MGFTYNGFGTSDKYKKIMDLGNHYCAHCEAESPHFVYEHTKRIVLLFIPVLKYNTSYWLGCDKCDHGREISESEKNSLLGISG